MFKTGQMFPFISLLIVCGGIYFKIARAKAGQVPVIRNIPALDAIEEAVGRATEMGRPIHFSAGIGALTAPTFAGLETLGLAARTVARYAARLIVTVRQPIVFPIVEEVVRHAYMAEGAVELFDPDDVRYLSSEQFAYASGVMGILMREECAANILLGYFAAESLIFTETGFRQGAIQIAGTTNNTQTPFFVATCDYVLIGEELYAAGAIASKNPLKLGSIAGQDFAKLYGLVLLAVGTLVVNFGSTWFNELLSK